MNIGTLQKKILHYSNLEVEEHDLGKPTMYLEPGRYLVGDASVLLTRVNSVKQSYRKFLGVDSGFHTLLDCNTYDSYHHIVLANKMDALLK